jgi:hypothetical protein
MRLTALPANLAGGEWSKPCGMKRQSAEMWS